MDAYTVFFCGTGSNSYDFQNTSFFEGELISTLARNHLGSEFVDWLIVDGPGSGNLQEAEKWVPSGNYSTIRGTLTGKGWHENVQHAIAVLLGRDDFESRGERTRKEERILRAHGVGAYKKERTNPVARAVLGKTKTRYHDLGPRISPQELQHQKVKIMRGGSRPRCVNVIGWSRGGVTCHMFANALAQTPGMETMPVNIFAVDPVPGSGNFGTSQTSLGRNVASYVGIYAADERSRGFSAVVPGLPGGTPRFVTTMPGRHATVVGNAAIDGAEGVNTFFAPGRVTRDLAESFLTWWGTPLGRRLRLSVPQLLSEYDTMIWQMPETREMQGESYTVLTQWGDRSVGFGHHGTSVDMSDVFLLKPDPTFVNSHHKWLFGRLYPNVVRALASGGKTLKGQYARELSEVDRLYPYLAARLVKQL